MGRFFPNDNNKMATRPRKGSLITRASSTASFGSDEDLYFKKVSREVLEVPIRKKCSRSHPTKKKKATQKKVHWEMSGLYPAEKKKVTNKNLRKYASGISEKEVLLALMICLYKDLQKKDLSVQDQHIITEDKTKRGKAAKVLLGEDEKLSPVKALCMSSVDAVASKKSSTSKQGQYSERTAATEANSDKQALLANGRNSTKVKPKMLTQNMAQSVVANTTPSDTAVKSSWMCCRFRRRE